MPDTKIIPFEAAAALCAGLRQQGRRIVLCHGIFELLHPGYIVHLEEARTLGDVLVVSLTADKFVNKGPGRPFCKEALRARTLAALACVDYVVVTAFASASAALEAVRPAVYCLGRDYERNVQKNDFLQKDLATAAAVGAEVRYAGSVIFSATKLLNHHFEHLPAGVKDFCRALALEFSMKDFREAVESFSTLRVLVMGDVIFDRYSFVKVQGLTSKNRIISGRFLREETQCGGALAVFRHVRQFTPHVRLLSLLGTEPWVDPLLREHVPDEQDQCLRDPAFTTIIKQRYVEPLVEGNEMSKLFSVNYIDAAAPQPETQARLAERARQALGGTDVVLLLDFGHGMMQAPLRDLVQDAAPLLALNCQTNSNNHGFNIISRQYRRADAFTLDEQELMLSCGHRHLDHQAELEKLRRFLKARCAWLTRGAVQTIGLCDEAQSLCPPFETEVVDTIGAGDAFFSLAALAAARRLPIALGTFLGQLAGAQAVKIVGNEHPISKHTLLNSGSSLLNF
ncbi:MAG TPA: PfkB family carbohydrate kinase [Candidatus Acidoferrum sp.]|nr:PfkB family carbohydrate kinase [Candidatus Acidoferrum sp.]